MQVYHQPPAAVSQLFDSAEVARHRAFGQGVLKTDRPFQPEPNDWAELRAIEDREAERDLDRRWYATRFEDEAAGILTDQDLIAAGLSVG